MIPRIFFVLLVCSAAAYVFIWLFNHEDRAFVRRLVKRGALALAVGVVATYFFINTDLYISALSR